MKIITVAANSILVLLSVCTHVQAATECLFSTTMDVDLKYADTLVVDPGNENTPTMGYVSVSAEVPFQTSQNVKSTCNSGKDGQVLQGKNIAPSEDMHDYTVVNDKQILMYNTQIKGLFYGIKIINGNCANLSGYLPPDQSFTYLYDVGDDSEKSCMKNDTPWKFSLQFFINSDYKYTSGEFFHSAMAGAHGQFRLSGSTGDVQPRTITVKTIQFNGQVK
jgi:hypothetical protein